jgi:hypothetical protein
MRRLAYTVCRLNTKPPAVGAIFVRWQGHFVDCRLAELPAIR